MYNLVYETYIFSFDGHIDKETKDILCFRDILSMIIRSMTNEFG